MKYFRTYPWGLQLLLFLLMSFTFVSSAVALILALLPAMTGVTAEQITNITPATHIVIVKAAIFVQGASSLFIFLLPAYVFAYLAHPRPGEYLGLRAPGKKIQWVLVVFIMLGATPVLNGLQELISHIDFRERVKAAQKANDDTMAAFLNMPDLKSFLMVFVFMAIIPALGEEMFFRGVLLRFAKKKTRTMVTPILFTAIVFAYIHSNVYGILSIFLAGVLLAVIYNVTGSLWCSILAHVFFNGLQIVLQYVGHKNNAVASSLTADHVQLPLVIGGAILFSTAFYLLLKYKTPLPDDWTEDFTQAELSQKAD